MFGNGLNDSKAPLMKQKAVDVLWGDTFIREYCSDFSWNSATSKLKDASSVHVEEPLGIDEMLGPSAIGTESSLAQDPLRI